VGVSRSRGVSHDGRLSIEVVYRDSGVEAAETDESDAQEQEGENGCAKDERFA
jgi:hypothetical protein